MEPTEKDIVLEKVKEMPPEQVAKVLIFIAGLEAGGSIKDNRESCKMEVKNKM